MVACIDFFEMSEICRPKFIVRHSTYYAGQKKCIVRHSTYYAGQKILAVIVCHFKKSNCNPYFIVVMITVLIIMNVIFWVVNFKTRNYFVISITQNVYLRLSMYDCSNFVHSWRIFGISEL
jgi:hypothetical protein